MAKCKVCGGDVGKESPEEIPDDVARTLRKHGLCPQHQREYFMSCLNIDQGNETLDDIDDLILGQLNACDFTDCVDNEVIVSNALQSGLDL